MTCLCIIESIKCVVGAAPSCLSRKPFVFWALCCTHYAACCLYVLWLMSFSHLPDSRRRDSDDYDDSDSESEDPFTSHQARRQTARGSQRGALPPFYSYQGAGWTSPFSSAPPLPWVTHAQTHRQTDKMSQWITTCTFIHLRRHCFIQCEFNTCT